VKIGIRELRQHASRYLAIAKAGETIQITDRGVLVALLGPPDTTAASISAFDRLVAAGHVIPAAKPFFPLPKPVPLPPGSMSTAEALEHTREERL